jgi:MFS family permease
MILAGALLFALLPFNYLMASTLTWLIVARFFHGAATAIMGPVAAAALSDVAPADRRGQWLAVYAGVQGAGQALGPVLGGVLIAATGFDAVFMTSGMLGLAALGSVAQASMFVLSGALNAFLPLFALDALGLSAREIGVVLGIQTVATVAARPLVGRWSDSTGRRGLVVGGLFLCSASVALVSMAAGFASLLMAIVCYGLGVAITSSAASAYITDVSPRARYGAAHGVFGTIYDVGDAAGPLVTGLLVSQVGYSRTFQLLALVGALTAAWFGSGRLRLRVATRV